MEQMQLGQVDLDLLRILWERVEIVELEDLDYEGNDKVWTVSIGN